MVKFILTYIVTVLSWEFCKPIGKWIYNRIAYKTVTVTYLQDPVLNKDTKATFKISVPRGSKEDPQALADRFARAIGRG